MQNSNAEAVTFMGDWTIRARLLKEKYPSLSDADLKYQPGRENELLSTMASRLHTNREEVIRMILDCPLPVQ